MRVGEVRELGWAATFLCSPYASYISGHTLVVDAANWLRRSLVMPEFVPIREQFGKRAIESGSAKDAIARTRRRSDERSVGKACVRTCSSRWSTLHTKKKK